MNNVNRKVDLRIEYTDVANIYPHPDNPREHGEENKEAIRNSLEEFGQVEPILVQRSTNYIVSGNGRYDELVSMGYTHVLVAYLDIDDEEASALMIAMNRTGDLSFWNEKLASELKNISKNGRLLKSTGFKEQDLKNLSSLLGKNKPKRPESYNKTDDFYDNTDGNEEEETISLFYLYLNKSNAAQFKDDVKLIGEKAFDGSTDTSAIIIRLVAEVAKQYR